MRITFEADSLEALAGEMRAFLAAIEKPRATAPAAPGTYTGPSLPPCPVHMVEMVFHPRQAKGRNGRPVSASYRCPRPGCRGTSVWLD